MVEDRLHRTQRRVDLSFFRLARCLGIRQVHYVARSRPQAFQRGKISHGAEIVVSEVEVAESTSRAASLIAAVRGPRGGSCSTKQLRSENSSEVTFDREAVGPAPPPLGSNGFTIKLSGGTKRFPLYGDAIGFDVGPALVLLIDTGWGSPPRRPTERRLLGLLYGRAKHLAPLLDGKQVLLVSKLPLDASPNG
jgi:hypothetical protein